VRIGLLTESIETGGPGFRAYTIGLVEELLRAGGHEYTLLHHGHDAFYDGKPHVYEPGVDGFPWLTQNRLRQYRLPAWLDRQGFDIVHDTSYFAPFLRWTKFARVMTIGDLTPIVTKTHPRKQILYHRFLIPVLAHRAHRILTFSECSKRDIVRLFRISPHKVKVSHLAADHRFRPMPANEVAAASDRLRLPRRFLLHVGTIEPRKNIDNLIRAYAAALPALGDTNLVLVGRQGWMMGHLPALIKQSGVEGRVSVRHDITDEDLPLVYNASLAVTYPSLYEGFGLPPLEAMQCGVPVLASNSSSLPEVVGDAAITIDPASVDEIATGMVSLVTNERLREDLASRGIERAHTFTWRRCAEETLEAYGEAAIASAKRGPLNRKAA
jgi:glycosyltransferase involved in cell wall biosynthesis